MKKLCLLTILCFYILSVTAQSEYKVPRLTKTAVGNSGCYAYLPDNKEPRLFDMTYSPDSSKVYTGDFAEGDYYFSVIVVKLKERFTDKAEKENMLVAYLDYLKSMYNITKSTGYGKGHTLESAPGATGMIDYWEDNDKVKWAIKGWADGDVLAVLMLYGPKEYPIFNIQQMFLDGFRFK